MKQDRIKTILEKISTVKIAVYGDFCLDAYWQMDPDGSELSVETGLQAESVASTRIPREVPEILLPTWLH